MTTFLSCQPKKLPDGSYSMREILVPIFKNGKCCYESPRVMDIRAYCHKELDTLRNETRHLMNPHEVYVDLSPRLYDIKIDLLDKMSEQ